jgi:hypothetical protein
LLRHRILPRLELRAGWSGVTFDHLSSDTIGLEDEETIFNYPSLGLRLKLWDQRGWLPQTSITASSPFDFDADSGFLARLNPQAATGYSWLVGDRWLISGNTGAIWLREVDAEGTAERALEFQQLFSFDWLINDRWSLYLQWAMLHSDHDRLSGLSHSLGPGISLPLFGRTQLDVTTAMGLDQGSPDFATQIFLSWLF